MFEDHMIVLESIMPIIC